jgi:hypothetical protein
MKNIAIDVEANLLNKQAKLKAMERDKIAKEQLKYSEAKLDILASTMKEMMQKVIMENELVVQGHHVSLVTEKERVTFPKHFATHPWYHGLENDHFMYSIHNIVKDETPT